MVYSLRKKYSLVFQKETKKKDSRQNDENPVKVAGSIQISNFELIRDIAKIVDFIKSPYCFTNFPTCTPVSPTTFTM